MLQLDLASLVTVADKEDDAQATLGDKVHAEVVSVNGNAATKTVDTNTPALTQLSIKLLIAKVKSQTRLKLL